jgi:hypothetical protein
LRSFDAIWFPNLHAYGISTDIICDGTLVSCSSTLSDQSPWNRASNLIIFLLQQLQEALVNELTKADLDCLQKIGGYHSIITSPCSEHVLQHLLSLGLIEQCPHISLPLEMMRITYQVTPAGRKYLKQH